MILHLCRVVKIIFFENWIFECLPQKLGSKFFWETLLAPKTSLFLLPPTFSYILLLPSTSSYFFLPISISYFSSTYLLWFGIVYGLVWYGGVEGGYQLSCKLIHEEISMLFCSEKFHGLVVVGDIAIIATSSRSRSLRDLR